MIAALHQANGDPRREGADGLLEAAAAIQPPQPGFEAAAYYRLEMTIVAGQKREAGEELDRLLALHLPRSAANQLRGLRMRSAGNLRDFFQFAARRPVKITNSYSGGQWEDYGNDWDEFWVAPPGKGELLDRDAAQVLNYQTPLRRFREAALSDMAPAYARRELVLTAFARAVLLNDAEHGVALAERLRAIGADPSGYLRAYLAAGDAVERRRMGIFYLQHHPEASLFVKCGLSRLTRSGRIDGYRENWWCPTKTYRKLMVPPLDSPRDDAAFLSEQERAEAAGEWKLLSAAGGAPDLFLAESLQWAQERPGDARVPEALHWALRSQRYGCITQGTPATAERAWRLMWRRYPKSPWTAKSNYPIESFFPDEQRWPR